MAAAVARQEHDRLVAEPAEQQLVRRLAERRLDAHPALLGETLEVVEAGAADDADHRRRRHGQRRITSDAA